MNQERFAASRILKRIPIIFNFLIIVLLCYLASCSKEEDNTEVLLDSIAVYQNIDSLRMEIDDAKLLFTLQTPQIYLHKMLSTQQVKQVLYRIGNDTADIIGYYRNILNISSDYFIVSGSFMLNNHKGTVTKNFRKGEKTESRISYIYKELKLPNSMLVRKSDGRVFLFPDEFKDISFGNDCFSGNVFNHLSVAQSDNLNNIYLFSGSVYKISLPASNQGIKVSVSIPKPWNDLGQGEFVAGRNGELFCYFTNVSQSAEKFTFTSGTGTEYNFSTFKKTGLNITEFVKNIAWQDPVTNNFYLLAATTGNQFAILKVVLPDSLALMKTIPAIYTDMSIYGSGYNVIVNPSRNKIVFPGVCKVMEVNQADFTSVSYTFNDDQIGTQLSSWNYYTKDYFFMRIGSKIYFYPKNIKTYSGTIPSLLPGDLSVYQMLMISTDYQGNKIILTTRKSTDNFTNVQVIDAATATATNISVTGDYKNVDQLFYLK